MRCCRPRRRPPPARGSAATATDDIFYAGASTLRLHASETAHYRDNLTSGRPALWVVLQPVAGDAYEVASVTADPYEGEALTQGNGEIVEAVPMPAEIRETIAAFVAAFHVERAVHRSASATVPIRRRWRGGRRMPRARRSEAAPGGWR